MGKIAYFQIVLQKPVPIYFSGETVVGTISYRVTERLKINGVFMNADGTGYVHWTESHGSGNNRHTVHYSGSETYFRLSIPFVAKPGNQDLYLEVGDYSYPFQIALPPNLPTSYETMHGRIRYSLTGTIDIPWAFDMHTCKAITVITHVDLNLNPALKQPVNTSASKTVCCCCFKSGPITATLSLRKTGFVCGEMLTGTAVIDNQSSRDVKQPTIHLYEQVRLHATRKTKTMTRKICSFTLPKVIKEKSSERFDNIGFAIPPVCPTLYTSRVIELNYFFDLNFDATGISVSTDLKIPLVIGTIPLNESSGGVGGGNQPNQPALPYPLNDQFNFQPNFFGPIQGSTLPPAQPEKGEVMESDSNAYIPQYPFYKDFSIQP